MTALPQDYEHEHPDRDEVGVTYNGLEKDIDLLHHETMEQLLKAALHSFGVTDRQHIMALWTVENVELPITGTVAEAGVHPGQTLVLRPSEVRGG
jgi:hypothetical protein